MGFFGNILQGLKKAERFVSGKTEEAEAELEPYALRLQKWFRDQYHESREAEMNMMEPIYRSAAERYKKPLEVVKEEITLLPVSPSIGGYRQTTPRVYRILKKAVEKGVSSKTLQSILKLKEAKLVPGLTETTDKLVKINKITPPKINLDRIDAPGQIKKQIMSWTDKNAQYLSERYPHQRFNDIQSELEREGFDVVRGLKTLKRVFRGDTKKTLIALKGTRDSAVTIEKEISALQKTLRTEVKPDKILLLTAQLKEKQLLRDALWEAVAGSGRASGQYLAFRRQMAQALKGGVGETKLGLIRLLGKRFEPGTPAYDKFFAALKNLDPNEPKEIMNFLRQAQAPKLTDFPASIWYNSILSGPKTQLVNLTGNSIFGTVESGVIKPISFLLDIPISAIQGRERIYTSKSMLGYYGGMARGLKVGTERFFKTLWTGYDPEEILYPSKWDQLRQVPWSAEFVRIGKRIVKIPEPLKPVLRAAEVPINIPTRLLKSADVWFKGIFGEARKFELALPKVYKSGKTLRQVISEADELARTDVGLWDDTVQFGRYMTFQDAPGKITRWIIKGKETIPGFRYVLPFVNIASNLLKRGFIDYAPPGLAKGVYQVVIKDPKAAETMARGLFGTVIMTAGAMKYLEGNIILEPPRTKAERDAFYRQGKQPWSIKIGNRYVGLRRIEPFSYPFFTGALIVDAIQKGKMNDASAIEQGGMVAQQLGEFATDASYLYGVNKMWTAMNSDWDEKGEQFTRWIEGLGVGFFPYSSALRSIATGLNPEVKEATTKPGEAIKSIIPGMREEVPERITVFGKPAEYVTGALGTFLPVSPSVTTQDPVEIELERLDLIIGFPSKPSGMKDETYRIYSKIAGRMSKNVIDKLIYHPGYLQVNNNTKRKLIQSAVSETRKNIRTMFSTRIEMYELFFNQFRNMGFNRDKSEYMADKALDKIILQSYPTR